ncbi:MAG TPA: hypothetical protein VGN72_22800 [Tepidisphaeraceae bacterium]|jgi:hypothetical protein|nr:hypothetical protein [Tepidisphaeraceae bacterium]
MIRSTCAVLMLCLLSTGCGGTKPDQTLSVSNAGYALDKLFTDPNGYSVYRFYDRGDFRYYVVGPNGAQMVPSSTTNRSGPEVGLGFGGSTGTGVGVGVGAGIPIGQ